MVLVDSIFAQSQYGIGRKALQMIQKILKNTESVGTQSGCHVA